MRRHNQKKPVKAKASTKQKEPETFEEFMDEAIRCEEQGDRYQTGDKAVRNYTKSAEMYGKAFSLNKDDADCVYNWGRILFILRNLLPSYADFDVKIEKVNESIEKFRMALQLQPNKTDAQFNLAQALYQKSEMLQEASDYTNAAIALHEAIDMFNNVYTIQEQEYVTMEGAASPSDTHSLSKTSTHSHDMDCDANCNIGSKEDISSQLSDMDLSDKGTEVEKEEFATVTRMEATTIPSLIETLVSTAEAMSTMASMLASYPASMDLFSRAKSKISLAEKWFLRMPSGDSDTEKEKKDARVLINLKEASIYSAMADRSFIASGQVDSMLYSRAVEKLEEIIQVYDSNNTEALCDLGDILSSEAQAIVDCQEKQGIPLNKCNEGKIVWKLYKDADAAFISAMKCDSSNTNIINKLGELNIIRAGLQISPAENNRGQLLKNASFYFKTAVEKDRTSLSTGYIGWAMAEWALEEWTGSKERKREALKIMRTWVKLGGNDDIFHELTGDGDLWDEEFLEFVERNLFK
ncbi:hypothetical protein BDB01DRAFT_832280 [Pilobolus umbonatus]|nr:hypothetical protein BDB01DRAFT_832280 [Pilobolus umbonatus]